MAAPSFSAFMFVRNGVRAGYTFMEAIENALPFVDEFYVLDGESGDGTLEALRELAALQPKLRVESRRPRYVDAPKDEKGLLLGQAFDEARQACRGDWLVQVQADTVFHPATLFAARHFLERGENARRYAALEIVRNQYRWNWQEMYREDRLALIFRKNAGRVAGDAINIAVDGPISRALVPLFERFPAADNAWVFFGNLAGKVAGCGEIWKSAAGGFPWYDKHTGRSFEADLEAYEKRGELPPQWLKKTSPFRARLPENLAPLVGLEKYAVAARFAAKDGLYAPSPAELEGMRAAAAALRVPLLERLKLLLG